METVELAARVVGQGPPLVVLHGVFGSGDNWGTFVKPWQERCTLHLLDLRNHGRSPWAPALDYPHLAADVARYITDNALGPVALMGHSMGGKTALHVAAYHPQTVARLAVIDIAPRAYTPHHQAYLAGLRALDPPTLQNRAQAEERMARHVANVGIRQFLLKSLARTEDGGFTLRLNVDALEANIEQVGKALPADARIGQPLLFVRGALSDYISAQDEADISARFPQAQVATVAEAGHWVHVDNPAGLAAVLAPFFGL